MGHGRLTEADDRGHEATVGVTNPSTTLRINGTSIRVEYMYLSLAQAREFVALIQTWHRRVAAPST